MLGGETEYQAAEEKAWNEIQSGDTLAWARHKTGYNEDDDFKSVATIPGPDGEDEVWVIVRRTIDGTDYKFVEQFQPLDFGDQNDAWFVDCGGGERNVWIPGTPAIPGVDVWGDYTEYFVGTLIGPPYIYKILANATTESALDTTWGDEGFFGYGAEGGTVKPYSCIQLDDGSLIVSFYRIAYDASNYAYLCKVSTDGTLDTTW